MGPVAVGRVRADELDAITIDAHGTLLRVVDPLPRLRELLPAHDAVAIAEAFQAEGRYYREHVGTGTDPGALHRLREDCVAVFNRRLGSALTVDEYIDAIRFEVEPGATVALERLRGLGLSLAVVGNWDFSLHERLAQAGLGGYFGTVVHAARKPDPSGLVLALERLGVRPERAVHVGDEDADEQAAVAAGMRFLPAPLAEAAAAIE
jgi:HAD superfamily hydrolase (TIGR01509 family)